MTDLNDHHRPPSPINPEDAVRLPVDVLAILAALQDQVDQLTATVETQQVTLGLLRRAVDEHLAHDEHPAHDDHPARGERGR